MRRSVSDVKQMVNRYQYSGVPEAWIPAHEAAKRPKLLYARARLNLDLSVVSAATAKILATRPLKSGPPSSLAPHTHTHTHTHTYAHTK